MDTKKISILDKEGNTKSFLQFCRESEELLSKENPNFLPICNEDGSFKTFSQYQLDFFKKHKISLIIAFSIGVTFSLLMLHPLWI